MKEETGGNLPSDAEGKVSSPDVVRAPDDTFHGGSISRIVPVVLSHNVL